MLANKKVSLCLKMTSKNPYNSGVERYPGSVLIKSQSLENSDYRSNCLNYP